MLTRRHDISSYGDISNYAFQESSVIFIAAILKIAFWQFYRYQSNVNSLI